MPPTRHAQKNRSVALTVSLRITPDRKMIRNRVAETVVNVAALNSVPFVVDTILRTYAIDHTHSMTNAESLGHKSGLCRQPPQKRLTGYDASE